MKIKSATIKDIQKVKFAEIVPGENENIIILLGKNKQGKTSFINGIESCFGGSKAIAELPLNTDTHAQNGYSKVALDNGLTVERKIGTGGTSLTVRDEDGKAILSPQKFVEEKLKLFSFNPTEFADSSVKSQIEYVKKILTMTIGKDLTKIEPMCNKYKENLNLEDQTIINVIDQLINDRNGIIYNARKDAGKQVKTLEVVVANVGENKAELIQELSGGLIAQKDRVDQLEEAKVFSDDVKDKFGELLEAYNYLHEKLNNPQTEIIETFVNFKGSIDGAFEHIQGVCMKQEDILVEAKASREEISQEITNLKAEQKVYEASEESVKLLKTSKEDHKLCDHEISELKKIKEQVLFETDLPVEGMEVKETGVYVNGMPFTQMSQSERLMMSIRLAVALNPELKVMMLENGNSLDEETFKTLREFMVEKDFQLWIEWVAQNEEDTTAGYLFKDGEIIAH